jgi:Membrane proteins related to metalloendopeptidases
MKKGWTIVVVIVTLLLSLGVTYVTTTITASNKYWTIEADEVNSDSMIKQEVIDVLERPRIIRKLFYQNQLIGVINSMRGLNELLDQVNKERYQQDFPNAKAQLGEDVYIIEENSFFVYENIDEKIADFVSTNELFSIEVDKVEFSNGVYAYVKSIADFEAARDRYLLNFISQKELDSLLNGELPPEAEDFGESRAVSIKVMENTRYTKGYTSIENILTDDQEYIEFLSYGYGIEKEYYTVEKYDTVEGVGSKNNGLSAQQVVTINYPILTSVNQVLEEGMVLNVTYYQSPINVIVEKETVVKEIVYPGEPYYEEDPTLRQGLAVTKREEVLGYNKVVYKETYVNGVLQEGSEILSREEVKAPEKAIIVTGTKPMPGIGTGNFRYPIDNPIITCRWFCYANHTAIDVQNPYNRYGPVYAADDGVVAVVGYHVINGNYMWIDHQNGYRTYYGHMLTPPYFDVGIVVQKGDIIGQVGETGRATGPHVHFVIEYQGVRQDPCIYLGC